MTGFLRKRKIDAEVLYWKFNQPMGGRK